MDSTENREVLLALSGGIDSAVAIYLLQQEGFTVHCVHFDFWHWEDEKTKSNIEIFEKIQDIFGVNVKIVEYGEKFKRTVVDQFIADEQMGLTPNPCIRCNPNIKFQLLMDIAKQANIHYIATGHYARVDQDPTTDLYRLKTGLDEKKDQSYMLCYLNQEILSHTIFPLGECEKTDIYQIGKKLGLPITKEDESQDLCFVHPENFNHFLDDTLGESMQGDITDMSGQIIGKHQGLHHYTIGQRKGIRVSATDPYYVIRKNVTTNTLIVGFQEDLDEHTFNIDNIHWIGQAPQIPYNADVKIRYHSKRFPAIITDTRDGQLQITVKEPIQGVTPGQYAVFCEKEIVTGGGRIIR